MFSKITLLIATMVAFVAATPVPGATGGQCNTGSMQCCQQVHQSQTDSHSFLAALVGANVQDVTAAIGTNCDPLSVVGLGSGAQCTQQPVCCTGNSFSGLVVVGCTPISVNL
ncbi:hydrophobin [Tricholoma matsutake]|nr:hydrophobin [Tricholoma matsutake 945]